MKEEGGRGDGGGGDSAVRAGGGGGRGAGGDEGVLPEDRFHLRLPRGEEAVVEVVGGGALEGSAVVCEVVEDRFQGRNFACVYEGKKLLPCIIVGVTGWG